MSGMYSNQ